MAQRTIAAWLLLVSARLAQAQCTGSDQCPPGAECVDARCMVPLAPSVRPEGDPGWSVGAAAYGFITSAAVLGLGLASELTRNTRGSDGRLTPVPSLPLGSSAVLLHLIGVPIVDAGSRSTRRPTGVRGSLGLRVTSWVLYGSAIGVFLFGAAYYAPRGQAPDAGVIGGAVTGTAFLSDLFMAIDAALAHSQAARRHRVAVSPAGVAGVF